MSIRPVKFSRLAQPTMEGAKYKSIADQKNPHHGLAPPYSKGLNI